MKFNSLIPELSVTNIEKSKEFYLSLGFKIKYERPINDNRKNSTLEYQNGHRINIRI